MASEHEPGKYELLLLSRRFAPSAVADETSLAALAQKGREMERRGVSRMHVLVQLFDIPSPGARELLRDEGVELLEYVPQYGWFASIPADEVVRISEIDQIRWLGEIQAPDKRSPHIDRGDFFKGRAGDGSEFALLLVRAFEDSSLEDVKSAVLAHGGKVLDETGSIRTLTVYLPSDNIEALAAEDSVSWMEPPLPPLTPVNANTRARLGVDILQAPPYGLDGSGVDVLVFDSGTVYEHADLVSRLTFGDASPASNHASHVACTILGDGSLVYENRGMAPSANLLSMGIEYESGGIFMHTDPGDLEADLDYAKNQWPDSADIFNISLGSNVASNGFPCFLEGDYGLTSQLIDSIVRGSLGEPFIGVWGVGNERFSGSCGSGYSTVAPPACAKNPVHVGAIDAADDAMAFFSSWGPCDDGRLKPVVVAPGVSVLSCSYTDEYVERNGTSMAAPAVAGTLASLLQHYRRTFSTDGEFLPSTARAILVHTAEDLGKCGPDFAYGYGLIDAVAAAEAVGNGDFLEEQIVLQGQIDEYTVALPQGLEEFRATLAWDDPAASAGVLKKLVDDLDLRLESPGGQIHRPWVLDPENPDALAFAGVDTLNNQEQVDVYRPEAGDWKVRVTGTVLPVPDQSYSLVFEGAASAVKNTSPGEGRDFPPTTCGSALVNGGFEPDTTPWVLDGSAGHCSSPAHSGDYSVRVGGTQDGSLCQEIVLPANLLEGDLAYCLYADSTESAPRKDFLEIALKDENGNSINTLKATNDLDEQYLNRWSCDEFALDSSYAGRTVRFCFSSDVDSANDTFWYIDDVSLQICASDSENTPPVFFGVPDQRLVKNQEELGAVDLQEYASDWQDEAEDLTFSIVNVPDPNAGVELIDGRRIDIVPADGWLGQTPVVVKAVDSQGAWDTDEFLVEVSPGVPFCDGFETGVLDSKWSCSVAGKGRVRVRTDYPHDGNYGILLDSHPDGGADSMAALVLSADVTGRDFLLLDFWWREFYDENHEEDGVFISDDDGENWVRVLSFNDGPSSYKKEIVDIASQAAANGLVLNDRFRIKFQFRDDSAIESDGYAIDSVCLMDGNYPPELPSQPAPADGAEEQHTELTLSWTGGDGGIGGEVSYDVYMGEDCPPADLLCSQATGESCQAGPLKRDTVYHWFVISTDADGASVKGPVWQFRTFEFSRQWTGEQSSDWLTAENWSPEIVPGPDDYVVISPSERSTQIASEQAAARELVLQDGLLSISGNALTIGGEPR